MSSSATVVLIFFFVLLVFIIIMFLNLGKKETPANLIDIRPVLRDLFDAEIRRTNKEFEKVLLEDSHGTYLFESRRIELPYHDPDETGRILLSSNEVLNIKVLFENQFKKLSTTRSVTACIPKREVPTSSFSISMKAITTLGSENESLYDRSINSIEMRYRFLHIPKEWEKWRIWFGHHGENSLELSAKGTHIEVGREYLFDFVIERVFQEEFRDNQTQCLMYCNFKGALVTIDYIDFNKIYDGYTGYDYPATIAYKIWYKATPL